MGRLLINTEGCVGLSETRIVASWRGWEFSLSWSASMGIKFSANEPISNSLKVRGEKGISMPGRKSVSMFRSASSQWNSTSSRSDTWYLLASMSCALTLESTSSRMSIVPCWSMVMGTRARWLIKKVLSSGQQQAPICQMKFLGTYCQFLDDIFYSQSNWFWSKVERPLKTVVGDWRNYVVLQWTENVWNENESELLVNCANQWGVDAIMP